MNEPPGRLETQLGTTIEGPDAQRRSSLLTELKHRLHPQNWSQRTALIVYGTWITATLCLGGYVAFQQGKDSLVNDIQKAALAGEPPATDPEVDEVLRRTRALVNYLEGIEAGPDNILVKLTACKPLQLPPDPDLLLDSSASAKATGLAMDCPTLGQGEVSERGVEVKSGPATVAAGWRISSGAKPTASAVLAVGTGSFKIGTSGVKAGSADNDASTVCSAGLDGSFDCDLNRGGKPGKLKVAADNGRALLVWLNDMIIKPRLDTIRRKGVITTSK